MFGRSSHKKKKRVYFKATLSLSLSLHEPVASEKNYCFLMLPSATLNPTVQSVDQKNSLIFDVFEKATVQFERTQDTVLRRRTET